MKVWIVMEHISPGRGGQSWWPASCWTDRNDALDDCKNNNLIQPMEVNVGRPTRIKYAT